LVNQNGEGNGSDLSGEEFEGSMENKKEK